MTVTEEWKIDRHNGDLFQHLHKQTPVEDDCEECGEQLGVWHQDTEFWDQSDTDPTKWIHSSYGEPYCFCECGIVYHGMPDGQMVKFRLNESEARQDPLETSQD